jgi:phytoene desaturase
MNKKVAVIGSGFGGLGAAIRLQKLGFAVSLFEKRDLPGGRAYVYKDQGFTFDAGPTVITAPHCIEELFEGSGFAMNDYTELLPVKPFYRLHWEDGSRFDYDQDLASTLAQIRKFSAADAAGYERFLDYSKEVFQEGYVNLVAEPFLNWWSMIRVSPQLIRLGAYRSVYSTVSKYVQSAHLREAFSFHSLLVGGNPFATSSIYTLIHYLERKWGVYFAKGGTGALVQALTRLFTDLGGKLHLNSPIEAIETRGGKVRGVRVAGGVEEFDLVVSNADVMHTYRTLLKDEPFAAPVAKRLKRMQYSMSLFLIYFGADRQYPELAHHNVLFGPRYQGLLDDIFKHGTLPEDFSLYLHAPTRTDPSMAPAGSEAFYVLSPVAHKGKLKVDWKSEGPRYAEKILNYLDQRYLSGLKGSIVTQRIFTPDDFETELNAHLGSAFSLEPTLTQSAYFRTHNKDERIRGLYFVGAGTHPGAGMPGVFNSAKATTKVIQADYPEMGPTVREVDHI